jgi:hypothetical protein
MSPFPQRPRRLVPAILLLSVAGAAGAARAESPGRATAAQAAVVRAGGRAADSMVREGARAKFGYAEVYAPSFFRPVAGSYDLVVHFHGVPSLQEENFERARVNAVVVSVNLGTASDAYANAFRARGSFDALVEQAARALEKTGRAEGATLGRIALEAWSAGFAAVGAILKQPGVAERIDAVLLADGPHSMYDARHQIYEPGMEKWVRFAAASIRGEKLFALTHSSIQTSGYPSTTETVGELLRETAVDKTPMQATGPRGMREIYESHNGSFHVSGYEGQSAKDHIDHIKGMGETLLPYLRARWDAAP